MRVLLLGFCNTFGIELSRLLADLAGLFLEVFNSHKFSFLLFILLIVCEVTFDLVGKIFGRRLFCLDVMWISTYHKG
jgi:hypothetical protein